MSFEIHLFFINSIFASAGSFFVVAVHFVIQASIACFGGSGYCASNRNWYCSMNSLKAFKVACGNQSGLNCKFCIPRGVVAVSNSILYPRRHILIQSYNERKLQQGVKKTSFLIFHTSLLQIQKYHSLLLNTSFFSSFVPDYCISSDYFIKEELMIGNYYVI